MRLRNWLVFGAIVVLAACGGSASAPATTAPTVVTTTPPAATAAATIDVPAPDSATGDYGQSKDKTQSSFTPAIVTVQAGSTVTWTNSDITGHTTTATGGAWNVALAPGGSFSRAFPTAGSFDFKCTIHPGMTGTVIVQ